MQRILVALAFGAMLMSSAWAQDSAAAMRATMAAVNRADWAAASAAARPAGPVAATIVEWHRLRAGEGRFGDYVAFLRDHDDWPGLPLLREKGEARLDAGIAASDVIAYFADQKPRTGTGSLALSAALWSRDDRQAAIAEARRAWLELPLTAEEEAGFHAEWPKSIAAYHAARIDNRIWAGDLDGAERVIARADAGTQALARARVALLRNQDGVDTLMAAVPAALAGDAGLAYARFVWRDKRGRGADAIAMMAERSTSSEALGRPEAWADRRRSLARELMRAGKPRDAYALASRHYLSEGEDRTDLEWLAGYIALTRLGDPVRALNHFQQFRIGVDSPISLGRAGYWEGRAYEAMGDAESARVAYGFGASYQTSFYGLLAAEKAGLPMDPELVGNESVADFRGLPAAQSTVFAAAELLDAADEPLLFTRFIRHLAERLTGPERGALAHLALQMDEPFAAVYLAKYAADSSDVFVRPYFPVTDIAKGDLGIAKELALSIARRESEFYPRSISPVGARGLMQLMPRTGEEMARKLGLGFSTERLIEDPAYNLRLGSAYLAQLMEEFDGYVPFVAAAYNAGPSRAHNWQRQYGDPRRSVEHAVDWIEMIPFRETQNYVMRVMESMVVYRARLSGQTGPIGLGAALTGGR